MAVSRLTQGTINLCGLNDYLDAQVENFLLDRLSQNLSPGTIKFYKKKLRVFCAFCEGQLVQQVSQIDAALVRRFLLWLEEQGHNPGGRHAFYRTVKAFLRWWANETEPEGWRDPFSKIKGPKVPAALLDPAPIDSIRAMLKTCRGDGFTDRRDYALLLALLDTGARADEFIRIELSDIDGVSGAVIIQSGKGRKPRTVFFGNATRRALRAYLKARQDTTPFLWVTNAGQPLMYDGLRAIITRRAKTAKVEPPSLHSFRRAFALNMLRSGVDIYSLQELMGHAGLQVLRRYLKQTQGDLRAAHAKFGPVDTLLKPRGKR